MELFEINLTTTILFAGVVGVLLILIIIKYPYKKGVQLNIRGKKPKNYRFEIIQLETGINTHKILTQKGLDLDFDGKKIDPKYFFKVPMGRLKTRYYRWIKNIHGVYIVLLRKGRKRALDFETSSVASDLLWKASISRSLEESFKQEFITGKFNTRFLFYLIVAVFIIVVAYVLVTGQIGVGMR